MSEVDESVVLQVSLLAVWGGDPASSALVERRQNRDWWMSAS